MDTAKSIRTRIRLQGRGKLLPPPVVEIEVGQEGVGGCDGAAEQVNRLLEVQLLASNLCSAMGLSSDGLDAGLCDLLRQTQRSSTNMNGGSASPSSAAESNVNLQYHIACLFIVFVANALPQLAKVSGCAYRVNLAANEGNLHCIAYAVTTLMVR